MSDPLNGTVWRRVFLPRAADAAAMATATYTLPSLVLLTTGSAVLTGAAFTLEWIPRLASFAQAGVLVGRHGAGRVMRIATAARAVVLLAAIPALAWIAQGAGRTWTVMLLAAVTGTLSQFSSVAAETSGAFASRLSPYPHRVQSVLLGIDQGAMLAGPALGGVLLAWTGPGGLLSTIALLSLSATVTATVSSDSSPATPTTTEEAGAGAGASGWATLRTLPVLAWLVAGLAVSNLATGTLEAATPVIVVKNLDHSSAGVGAVWSLAAAATLLVVAVCRPAIERWGLWRTGAVAALVASIACLAVAQAGDFPLYVVLVAALMAAEGAMTVVLRTMRSLLVPAENFARTMAVTALLLLAPLPVGGLLVACAPAGSLGSVLTGCGLLQAAALAFAFAKTRSRIQLPMHHGATS